MPMYAGITRLPEAFTVGGINEFSWDSAWWVFNFVSNFANLKYSYMIGDIQAVQGVSFDVHAGEIFSRYDRAIGLAPWNRNLRSRIALHYAEIAASQPNPAVKRYLRQRAAAVIAEKTGLRPRIYQDYRELLESSDVDAVVLTTPEHSRALPCIQACQAGKDVFCDKPLSLTVTEGRAMVRAARQSDSMSVSRTLPALQS